jgi:hypothetical protein
VDILRLLSFPPSVQDQLGILEGVGELLDDFQRCKFIGKPFLELLVTLLMAKVKTSRI